MCWIYSKSAASFFSQLSAFRPRVWARPVSPGRTECRLRCSGVMKTISRTSCGRGPTTDMSPFKMLNTSGSSSREVARRLRPKAVSVISSGSSSPCSSGASVMVRNLYSLKIFSSFPGLGCTNKTGEPNLKRTNTATRRYSQTKTSSAAKAQTISSTRFMYRS